MKFNRYLTAHEEDAWKGNYIRYRELKKLLHQILEAGAPVEVPTALSLTVGKTPKDTQRTPQEEFFRLLEADVQRISEFTTRTASELRSQLQEVSSGLQGAAAGGNQHQQQGSSVGAGGIAGTSESASSGMDPGAGPGSSGNGVAAAPSRDLSDAATREYWLAAARRLGEEYLRLEKYVNLNYTGLQKILKKHDKLIPSAPCWNFYKVHINCQPWVRGDHHDLQVTLSSIFARLHAAAVAAAAACGGGGGSALAPFTSARLGCASHHKDFTNITFWVPLEQVTLVKRVLMRHMAVQQPPDGAASGGAAALWAECDLASRDVVNCMFLDNASLELYHNLLYGRPYAATLQLRWYGSRVPQTVDVIRQVYREGWRPEACTEDSFPIQETRVADFLNGRWTWADARKLMMPEEYDTRQNHHHHRQHSRQDHSHQGHPSPQHTSHGVAAKVAASSHRTHGSPSLSRSSASSAADGGACSGGAVAGSSRGGGAGGGVQTHGSAADDPSRLAKEYQLFKTFTEVARLVESKGLQPMVQVRFRQTIFYFPCDDLGVKVMLEEDLQMLLEYAYDTATRLSYGLWRQEHPADAIEFPYAIFKVQRPDMGEELPRWLKQLMQSGLMRPMNDYSKFLHGCAGLLPDMVRAVPQWIDDEAVQKSLYANVMANEELQALLAAGHNVVAELEEGVLDQTAAAAASSATARTASVPAPLNRAASGTAGAAARASANSAQPHAPNTLRTQSMPLRGRQDSGTSAAAAAANETRSRSRQAGGGPAKGGGDEGHDDAEEEAEARADSSSPIIPLLHSLQRSVSSRLGAVQAGWQAKLLQRQALQGRAYQPHVIFLDPSQFLRNERIFLQWMRTAITVGGIATGMLGFAASAYTDPYVRPTIHISETTAFVLLAMAIAMAGYGLAAFVWRSTRFYELHPGRFDDTSGALAMTVVVTFSLFALLICNMADLMEVLGDGEGPQSGQGQGLAWRPGDLAAAEAQAGLLEGLQPLHEAGQLGRGGGAAWRRV